MCGRIPGRKLPAFEKIVFGADEGPEGLPANIERFDAFLKANKVPEEAQARCWAATMVRLLGIGAGRAAAGRASRPAAGMVRRIEESELDKNGNRLLVPRKMTEAMEMAA